MTKSLLTKTLLAEIKAEGLPAPVLEHKFHSIRRWRFDCAWPEQMIAIEIHGGVYAFGHHVRGKGFEDDREKMNEATVLGWRVLEYSTGQVKKGIPILDLKRLMTARTQPMRANAVDEAHPTSAETLDRPSSPNRFVFVVT